MRSSVAFRSWHNPKRNGGIALVLVLASLVLLSAIILAFFMTATSNRAASSQFAYTVNAKVLSETSVNLVIAQVQAATSGSVTSSGTVPLPWASQPGMIRTFDPSGTGTTFYKLYSSGTMVQASGPLDMAGEIPPNDWDKRPAIYTDLNEPALISGTLEFPIVDPRAMDPTNQTGTNSVEGFSYTQAIDGVSLTSGSQRLPMPAQWLYILESGSLVSPGPSNTGIADFSSNPSVSASNGIVGRIAFWTDDETCKVNVNTASEAIPWDIPRCYTPDDLDYAAHLPVKHEVQRYPGHPATTCLSSVFFPNQYLDPVTDKSKFNAIYDLVPKISGSGGYLTSGTSPITYDDDRLYASFDEILFNPSRNINPLLALTGSDKLSQSRFFLTANSRAPEINQFGLPRICLWPVSVDLNPTTPPSSPYYLTGLDRTIAFCTTINGYKYFFERNRNNLSTSSNDTLYKEYTGTPRNFQLYKYLSSLGANPIPGWGGSLRDKYMQNDNANGLSPATVSNLDFGLFNMLEYIRTTNQADNTLVGNSRVLSYTYTTGTNGLGLGEIQGANIGPSNDGNGPVPGITTITPGTLLNDLVDPNQTNTFRSWRSFGRTYSVSEVAMVFSCPAVYHADGSYEGDPAFKYTGTSAVTGAARYTSKLLPGEKAIEVGFLYEGFCPMQGYMMMYPDEGVVLAQIKGSAPYNNFNLYPLSTGTSSFYNWNPQNHLAGGTDDKWELSNYNYHRRNWNAGWGGSGGIAFTNYSNPNGVFPMRAKFWKIPENDTQFRISPFGYVIRIRQGELAGNRTQVGLFNIINSGTLAIPAPALCDPSAVWSGSNGLMSSFHSTSPSAAQLEQDLKLLVWGVDPGPDNEHPIAPPRNVVRSFVANDSDYRLPSLWKGGQNNSENIRQFYTMHPLFLNTGTNMAHSLTTGGGLPLPGASLPRGLVQGITYPWAAKPDSPIMSGTVPGYNYWADPTYTRDWDNGTGITPDGAYANKPDDGSTAPNAYFAANYDDPSLRISSGQELPSPNRLIPSAVQFGSLPSAPLGQIPWTTYLFRPDLTPPVGSTSGTGGHLGSARNYIRNAPSRGVAPPDHALLDWFWLPIVEPYAISEPFSTAGKINMNYQIMPFTYIRRATGLNAVLKSEKILAIPDSGVATYKTGPGGPWRFHIDADKTLAQFDDVFSGGDVFHMESQICEQFLVPKDNVSISGTTGSAVRTAMVNYWQTHRLSGDNTLERPYANIYPRLTTRSNTFTVHYRVQVLKKVSRSNPSQFVDPNSSGGSAQKDVVVSEYRGSTTFERYIDPKDPSITVDYLAQPTSTDTLDHHYKFRILNTKQFAP